MTDEEARQKTIEKVQKVKDLCKELQLTMYAKQKIAEDMSINTVVAFADDEIYPLVERGPEETKNAEDTPLQQ